MKQKLIFNLALAGLVASLGVTGCRTKQPDKGITIIRGTKPTTITDPEVIGLGTNVGPSTVRQPGDGGAIVQPLPPIPVEPPPRVVPLDSNIAGARGDLANYDQDRTLFALNTVLFDYDRSVVKPAYITKIQEAAVLLKGMPSNRVLIEGHCDERGTEEYNRALGERRALAVREQLVRAGVNSDRIFTLSFGKDRAAQLGHDESSWSKNRRGEFVLLRSRSGGASLNP